MKKIAVVLSGCGHKDGTEITEAVSCSIALHQLGVEVDYFAPSQPTKVFNHLNQSQTEVHRIPTEEAARMTRGKVFDLKQLDADSYDGLVIPGGFGATQVLSTWNTDGHKCTVLPELRSSIEKFHKQSKPIGAICIAPVLVSRVLGKHQITVTVGADKQTISEVEKTGAIHETCPVDDFITDRDNKIITTPAYMYETTPHLVFKGISGLIKELVEMA